MTSLIKLAMLLLPSSCWRSSEPGLLWSSHGLCHGGLAVVLRNVLCLFTTKEFFRFSSWAPVTIGRTKSESEGSSWPKNPVQDEIHSGNRSRFTPVFPFHTSWKTPEWFQIAPGLVRSVETRLVVTEHLDLCCLPWWAPETFSLSSWLLFLPDWVK